MQPVATPNILVVRLSSLGDIVLTVPVYKNLKAHWPGCRIAVLVKPQYLPVLEGHPCVDEVIAFRGLLDAVRLIGNRGFSHLLDLHCNFRSFVIRCLSAIPNKARYRKDALARRVFVSLGYASPALTKHTIDRYLESLKVWGVAAPTRVPAVVIANPGMVGALMAASSASVSNPSLMLASSWAITWSAPASAA